MLAILISVSSLAHHHQPARQAGAVRAGKPRLLQAKASSSATFAARTVRQLRGAIRWHRGRTWHWQDVAGVNRTPTSYQERRSRSVLFLRWADRLWFRRQVRARHTATSRPRIAHLALWLCIHHGEAGDWHNEDTGHNGHYGGLQMHWSWGYGISGDPARYTMRQQLTAAERGYRASGYSRAWLLGQWYHPECLGFA